MKHAFARHLRKNMTDAERRLWSRLRQRQMDGIKFRRQVPIGPYIADFASHELRLVIEIDGAQHAESGDYDRDRTEWLRTQGYEVIRFWNHQVLRETESVLETIWRTVRERRESEQTRETEE